MSTLFSDFSKSYEELTKEFPDHPLTEEIRHKIALKKIPTEKWLRARTKMMRALMSPLWRRWDGSTRRDGNA
jgi:hypothetical protein